METKFGIADLATQLFGRYHAVMGMLKEYDPEPLVEAVTALDWNTDHPTHAMEAIRETIFKNTGDDLSEVEALTVLGRLLERRFIKTRLDPPASSFPEGGRPNPGRKGKYFRVPDNER